MHACNSDSSRVTDTHPAGGSLHGRAVVVVVVAIEFIMRHANLDGGNVRGVGHYTVLGDAALPL